MFSVRVSLFAVLSFFWTASLILASSPKHAFSPNGVQPRAGTEVVVASDGAARVPITIAPQASPVTREAAKTLADFLKRITGGDFSIETGAEPRGITVGTLTEFPDASLNEVLKIGEWNDGREAFAIRTGANGIRLIGGADLGAQHAVHRFLELMGVRRFFPSREWEIVPDKPDLVFDAEEESRPAILSRRVWMAFGMGFGPSGERRKADQKAWERHNRMDHSLEVRNAHMYQAVYRNHKAEFDANKETYYAEIKGRTDKPGKFNLANPRVRELIIQTALSPLDRADGKKVDMLSIEPSDGGGWSESPENRALGSNSDRAAGLANDLARALDAMGRKDVQIGLLAYFQHADPPSGDLDPRVHVMLATRMYGGLYDLPKLKELWKQKTANLGIYDYYATYVWGQERLRDPGAYFPAADPARVAADLDEYINDLKIRSISAESLGNWGFYGPGYYVAVHKMWDPRSDPAALLSDFYEKAFGPAAEPMRAFYELLFPSSGRLANYDTLRRLYERLDAAAQAARDEAPVLTRINRLKQLLHANMLTFRGMLETDEEKKKALKVDYYTLVHRTEDSDIMAAVPVLTQSAPADKLLNLKGRKLTEMPWSGAPPMTDEETEERFRADLEFLSQFGPAVEPVSFSSDLAVVALSDEPRKTRISARESGALTFVSTDGAPVTVTFQLDASSREGGGEVSYLVFDDKGAKVAKGTVPVDKEKRVLRSVEVAVPGPGTYRFQIPEYRGMAFGPETSAPCAVVVRPDDGGSYQASAGELPLAIYVPKGTREIVAHVGMTKDRKLRLIDSAGRTHEGEGVFGIVQLSVPEGEDGKLWTLANGQKIAPLYFYNIPNMYSLDTKRALLPREVAQADGLL
jgi:hypothetical protein